jgi:signal transduction histidine kinase
VSWLGLTWRSRRSAGAGGLLVGLLIAATLIASASMELWESRRIFDNNTEAELSRLSLTLSEHTASSFESVDLVLRSLIEHFRADGVDSAETFRDHLKAPAVQQLMHDRIADTPFVEGIGLIGSDGQLVNHSRIGPQAGKSARDRDYYLALRDDPNAGLFVGASETSKATGWMTLFLVRRMNGATGEFAGLLVGAIETRFLEDFFASVAPGADGGIALFRSDGMLLASHPHSPSIGRYTEDRALFAAQGKAPEAFLTPADAPSDPTRITAPHAVRGFPLVIDVSRSKAAVNQGWRQLSYVVGGITLTALALIAAACLLFSRQQRLRTQMGLSLRERQHAEEARVRAEAANTAKSAFLANMSHELRTPLNAIIGFSEVLNNRIFGPLNQKQIEYLGDISRAGHHLLGLINSVLDMSKIEAGHFELSDEDLDLDNLIDETFCILRGRADETGVRLHRASSEDTAFVRGDSRALLQILVNLVGNAIKFTPEGGDVTVARGVALDGSVTIDVSDTGIGIAPEDLPYIFEPFKSSSGHLSRKGGGTGLGLSITGMLVAQHGGAIGAVSIVGEGTTISVRLPSDRVLSLEQSIASVGTRHAQPIEADDITPGTTAGRLAS